MVRLVNSMSHGLIYSKVIFCRIILQWIDKTFYEAIDGHANGKARKERTSALKMPMYPCEDKQ